MFPALIFDLDGTLVDSLGDIAASVNYTLSRMRLPSVPEAVIRGYIGDGMKTLLERALGQDRTGAIGEAIGIFRPHYLEHCLDRTRLYPDVRETLDHFRGRKIALVTNKPLEITERILGHFQLSGYFTAVLGGESTQNKKPHPEPVWEALAGVGARPDEGLLVGDGLSDVRAGKAAGTATCAVTYGYKSRESLAELKPDFIIGRFSELPAIV